MAQGELQSDESSQRDTDYMRTLDPSRLQDGGGIISQVTYGVSFGHIVTIARATMIQGNCTIIASKCFQLPVPAQPFSCKPGQQQYRAFGIWRTDLIKGHFATVNHDY